MNFNFESFFGTDILIPAASAAILLIIAFTFLFLYFKGLKEDVHGFWVLMQAKIGLRLDKLPNLIETIRGNSKGQEQTIAEIIKLRNEAWKVTDPSPKKVQLELNLSSDLHGIWDTLAKNGDLQNNVNFLAIRKEIIDLGREIDHMADEYNDKVLHYNKRVGWFLPFAFVFGYRKMSVFEFEA